MEARVAFALLMGGEGRRFGGKKQFAPYGGEPLYLHSLKAAVRWGKCASFLLVVPSEDKERVKEETSSLPVDGVFIAAGRKPASEGLTGVELDEAGYVLTDDEMRTNLPGVFAAGDIRRKTLRQVVTAAADGAIAAENAVKYVNTLR